MKPYNALEVLKPEKMTDADLLKCRDLCQDVEAHLFDEQNRIAVLAYLAKVVDMLEAEIDRRGIKHGCDGRMGGDWEYPEETS